MQENALFCGEIFFYTAGKNLVPTNLSSGCTMGFEAGFCISLQKLDTPDSTVIDFFRTTLITFNVEIQYFQSTFHKDEVMKTPWLPIMKCYSYLMISNKMYQTLSFDPESNGDTNAPNGIDPAFFQDQVRGNEGC